ncbi:MAG TPA: D-2-hydroxyacid dehydrogenase [Candidatus Limnocylindrales bacterium]|nr:D-2-hydroxyacid dehydrogenase [Candidatus Limnocylindrales bacterium]
MSEAKHNGRAGKIVVLDGATLDPGDNPWTDVAALGTLVVHERTSPEAVVERARGAAIILTNKTLITADALNALPELRMIAVLATGTNVVDLEAAAARGIVVCNVPEYSTESVAQHVFALLLEVTNAVGAHAMAVAEGAWSRSADFSFWLRTTTELAGKTFGIVGHGRIGCRVGEIASAFGMRILAHSPSRSRPGSYRGFAWASVEQIFEQADIVSLHCPLTDDNERFVDASLLRRMRSGSILINTARGGLIDEAALARALASGRPAAAALDVLSAEPPPSDHPLLSAPACWITPHMAWSTLAARQRLMRETAQNVRAFLDGTPRNVVVGPARGNDRRGS